MTNYQSIARLFVIKGIRVQVTRMAQDCTNDGISATHEFLTLVGQKSRGDDTVCALPVGCQLEDPTDDAPAVALDMMRGYGDADYAYMSLVPVEFKACAWIPLRKDGHVGPAHGGNTATSDHPEWSELCNSHGAKSNHVNIHDRYETVEEYTAMI